MRVTLTVTAGPHTGRVFTFAGHDTFLVGRSKKAHFQLASKDRFFSRVHFMVEVNPPRCRLLDLDSRNGTYVNEQRVQQAELKHGDTIRAGKTVLQLVLEEAPVSVAPAVHTSPVVPSFLAPPPRITPPVVSLTPAGTLGPPPAVVPVVPSPFEVATQSPVHTMPVVPPRQESAACRACGAALPPAAGAPPLCPACEELARGLEQLIPGYRLVRELGRGGMGTVYLAVPPTGGPAVALKMVTPGGTISQTDVERFLREANILRQLQHAHVVRFHDMGEANGRLFFTMEYVRGTDAHRLIRSQGALALDRAVTLGCQLLEALEYAHALGFVHRDIKPSNLLVTQEGGREAAKLTDFGLARVYQASALSGLTLAGDIGGTPGFMAPEQITNFREAKPTVDQYAAAATLYSLLTASHIYDLPAKYQQLLMKILYEEPVPVRTRRADVPEALARVIEKGLAREPELRFPDVRAMRAALIHASL
ncbi:MAG: protein kinase [Gemmataceae bacterium]|nr:protein kinase [Gemmataceae bacterium]